MRTPNQFVVAPALERGGVLAFTLIESLIAVLVAFVMLTALYASFASGFATIKLSRQDLRATQIVLQRLENLRLCNFTNIQNTTESDYYDPKDQGSGGGGAVYTVTMTAMPPTSTDMPAQPVYYMTNMQKITVTATWTNGNILRTRTMQTYVAKNGVQSYVFRPVF